ncbi:MAG: hypothetical protein ACTHW1_07170 [Ancrocorticia sp.]|uniref:hypothetical protein n=1 Tax=Ancrocorticia sp. TaxID=2593684 RepID=UPI003F93C7A6
MSNLTKRHVKDHLSTNLWTVGTMAVLSLLSLIVLAIFGNRVQFSLFGVDYLGFSFELNQAGAEPSQWADVSGATKLITIAAVAVGVVMMVCYITSITYAATARTYLGAGVARRTYMKSQLAAWAASALSVAIACLLVAVIAGFAQSDFSGTVAINEYELSGLLWYAPLAALVGTFLAHAAGFLTGIVFVRLPWFAGVGAILAFVILDSVTDGGISSWGGFLDWSATGGGAQLLKHVVAGTVQSVAAVGISWALLRHLAIRR